MKPCPVKNCNQYTQGDLLACHAHWVMIPREIRNEFHRVCRRAPGTPTHVAAVKAVEDWLGRRAC